MSSRARVPSFRHASSSVSYRKSVARLRSPNNSQVRPRMPRAARSARKARNGAIPVPGPTMITGIAGSAGSRKWLVWIYACDRPRFGRAIGQEAAGRRRGAPGRAVSSRTTATHRCTSPWRRPRRRRDRIQPRPQRRQRRHQVGQPRPRRRKRLQQIQQIGVGRFGAVGTLAQLGAALRRGADAWRSSPAGRWCGPAGGRCRDMRVKRLAQRAGRRRRDTAPVRRRWRRGRRDRPATRAGSFGVARPIESPGS